MRNEDWLFAIYGRSGELTNETLTLRNLDKYVVAFTAQPERKAAILPYQVFIEEWDLAFKETNPNGVIAFYTADGEYREEVVELFDPRIKEAAVTFSIKLLGSKKHEGTLKLGESALFIDGGALAQEQRRVVEESAVHIPAVPIKS